jgi:hypothetical protein
VQLREGRRQRTGLINTDNRNVNILCYGDRDFNSFSQWLPVRGRAWNQTIVASIDAEAVTPTVSTPTTIPPPSDDRPGLRQLGTTPHNYHFTQRSSLLVPIPDRPRTRRRPSMATTTSGVRQRQLHVDFSGTHPRTLDSVIVNADTNDMDGVPLGLVEGKIYENSSVQAERNTNNSTIRLFARRLRARQVFAPGASAVTASSPSTKRATTASTTAATAPATPTAHARLSAVMAQRHRPKRRATTATTRTWTAAAPPAKSKKIN